MITAYIDCIGGASGDMLLGALVDVGVKPTDLRRELGKLSLSGWKLSEKIVIEKGIKATKINVVLAPKASHINTPSEVLRILHRSTLSKNDQQQVLRVFSQLAEAEARVHRTSAANVHFHEMGSIDTMIDIVGAVCGLRLLGIKQINVSPLPTARCGPATMELLKGFPVFGVDESEETVTPTGAAILTTLATNFGPMPAMSIRSVGYGAGSHELKRSNLLRMVIGEASGEKDVTSESLVVLETNIDDINPQLYDHVSDRLFLQGALDVWLTLIQMKKNRPAVMLSILCHLNDEKELVGIVFEEGLTLGIRRQLIERLSLQRETRTVKTKFGEVRVKVASFHGKIVRAVPEYDDCKKLAITHHTPLKDIVDETRRQLR